MSVEIDGFWAVIPAGGSGTRLWPLSRRSSPKFLHDLAGSGQSLLQDTVDRLTPLVGERLMVVTGAAHELAVREQLPSFDASCVVAEPSPRDSMPAIGLAAAIIERRDPDAVFGSFAADHVITRTAAFHAAVTEAVALAKTGEIVTIGIEPTYPATGFGYIRLGESLDVDGAPHGHRVKEFVEKPNAATAAAYLECGEYRWNAGMFVARATTLLNVLAEQDPELAGALRTIAAEPDRLAELWPQLRKVAIDHAVAEPAAAAGRVAVVPATLGWDDIGGFAALSDHQTPGTDGVTLVRGDREDVVAIDASGLVSTCGRTVALVGVKDIVVIDTPDGLPVTTREAAQNVKAVVDELHARGRSDLL